MVNYRSKQWMARIRAMRGKKRPKKAAGSIPRRQKTRRKTPTMARRRNYRRRSGGGLGGFSIKKLAVGALAGMALGSGIMGYGAGYLLGGIPGVIGAFAAPYIAKMTTGGTSSGLPIKIYS